MCVKPSWHIMRIERASHTSPRTSLPARDVSWLIRVSGSLSWRRRAKEGSPRLGRMEYNSCSGPSAIESDWRVGRIGSALAMGSRRVALLSSSDWSEVQPESRRRKGAPSICSLSMNRLRRLAVTQGRNGNRHALPS